MSEHPTPVALLRPDEVARRLGIAPATLTAWRRRGHGPRVWRLTQRALRYDAHEVEAWLRERTGAANESGDNVRG